MMNSSFRFVLLLSFCIVAVGYLSGCGSKDTPGTERDQIDPHDKPITAEQKEELKKEVAQYADLVNKIKEFNDIVREETKGGIPENPFAVHQALDKLDIITQWASGIARDSKVPSDQWETVTTASNSLRQSFEKIHQNIDKKKDPGYPSVAEEIDEKIAELQALVK